MTRGIENKARKAKAMDGAQRNAGAYGGGTISGGIFSLRAALPPMLENQALIRIRAARCASRSIAGENQADGTAKRKQKKKKTRGIGGSGVSGDGGRYARTRCTLFRICGRLAPPPALRSNITDTGKSFRCNAWRTAKL